jgi:cytoskeletal protein CcmA (bactofilin family)
VSPYLAVAALILISSLMFILPLVPSLVELRRKSDALPLNVVQENAGEIRHFADSFRRYIQALEPTMQRCIATATVAREILPDGEECVVLGAVDQAPVLGLEHQDSAHPVVIAAGADLVVPPSVTFSKDIYARGQFQGGEKNNYRAILGEKDVRLGASSRVVRWVHAVGTFTADLGCRLHGRISSDSLIRLHADCTFLRLNAPRIEIGRAAESREAPSLSSIPFGSGTPPRFFHDGDFEIRAGEIIRTGIVIRGNLHIRSGARICGSVKSANNIVLEDAVLVEGSLISARKMHIGQRCAIHGPIVAERDLAVAAGTRCGSFEHPTTVSAPSIELEEDVVVFGTLWARERGQVVSKL